ncbi:4-hydroxy-tetrahydrodipicolinate synthase [Lactococcus hircilactis]|uniref:4-hydroxy-tetrahydrodipicolinate synthase n=1 Tax=Lactococcus hircilactis TaxID=1494462 RepID=A0A7X1ZB37_9LACT|nr:4-hydroxy-tetrahydrodipicolinate synthase [Lactococcus hircilactis]MQW40037.1 4-hydroxy-tetrahydrodipicolinate synthase [Lactococcus hircilactis]
MSLEQLKNAEIITALVTPFKADGSINFEAYAQLVEDLIAQHTQAFILAGTTAESPTLSHEEELEIFEKVHQIVKGRVPLIAGIGTNDTRDSVAFAKEVAALGYIDAGLAVTPYYNKPSQEGIYQHFKAIAESSDLPIILYNIPGRVVQEIELPTLLRLAQLKNIIGTKDCTTVDQLALLVDQAPKDFLIYTGEDGFAFHAKALGAKGVVSVASHVLGQQIYEMFDELEHGSLARAAAIQRLILPQINALFSLPSPAPIKAVLNAKGYAVGGLRLPLVEATVEEAKKINAAFHL